MLLALGFAPLLVALPLLGDRDGDGLTDLHEVHKYRTDPAAADSDGDGVPDGDWHERREFTYVVRSVVQVMRPVTPEYLNDDFQDARVLDETADWVELEVIHYPFSTAQAALPLDPEWQRDAEDPGFARWLAPGPTSDQDAELADEIRAAMAADGLDLDALTGAEFVRRVSAWLLRRAEYDDSFTTFSTAFDDGGRPFIPAELLPHVNDGNAPSAEDWERELSAAGMFRHRTRGSCSSSAIYLSGCLRALGVPTRTVLCIPLFDAGDEREWALVRGGIAQPYVRQTVLAGMQGMERSWSSHTFNEVMLDGRWFRLDYQDLGAGILRRDRFGLMTHVATFHDWADARMAETIGRRQALGLRDARFDGANPYSMIAVRDEIGAHCTLELPAAEVLAGTIASVVWTDDPSLDEDVAEGIERANRFGLLARVEGPKSSADLRDLLAVADLRVYLEAEGHPRLSIGLDANCWWYRNDHALVYLPFGAADRRDLVQGVDYVVLPRNDSTEGRISALPGLTVRRGE